MTDAGKGITEAMGGFWQATNADPEFIPLDEVISKKFMDALERGEPIGELVLEDEFPPQ